MSKALDIANNLSEFDGLAPAIDLSNVTATNITGTNVTPTNLNIASTSHTFTVKGIDEVIYEDDGTTVVDSDSGQFAVYNGATKLFGITEHGYTLKTNQPAFLALGSSGFVGDGSVAGDELFQYTNTLLNVGGHYDSTSTECKFTAPIGGNYMINWWCSVASASDSARYFRLRLNKNGSYLFNPHNTISNEASDNDYNLCGGSAVVPLAANDYLQVTFGSSVATNQYAFYSDMNFFSGYLIG